jgi:predicted TIM-barrel fold metal-dependent hydrolase
MVTKAYPDDVAQFAGRIIDVDTHEMMPLQAWEAEFGPSTKLLADTYKTLPYCNPRNKNNQDVPEYVGDLTPIDEESVWKTKGPRAPGSTDLKRRLEVMDAMGVQRTLLFPTSVGLFAAELFTRSFQIGKMFDSTPSVDAQAYARELFVVHNDWAVAMQTVSPRLRPVGLVHGDTVEDVYNMATDLVRRGIRAVWLIGGELPGGVSPAHSDMDPVWKLLQDNNVVLTLHIGADGRFMSSYEWGNAPAFNGYREGLELKFDPWSLSVIHLASQNYVSVMVTGGVFERFPKLRLGVTEVGAHWVGPLTQMLDMFYENGSLEDRQKRHVLSELPSYYIKRNMRVSAFDFEPVDRYVETYGLEDVICYASDYPHVEGGTAPMVNFAHKLERFGPEVMEKFFVTNGQFLLPD